MPPTVFELTIPASERPSTHALDRAATGLDFYFLQKKKDLYLSGVLFEAALNPPKLVYSSELYKKFHIFSFI
jgi:hypothetical protein